MSDPDTDGPAFLNRQDVLHRLCAVTSNVMRERFHCDHAADCFCGMVDDATIAASGGYRFAEPIMRFIEEAVDAKLAAEYLESRTDMQLVRDIVDPFGSRR